MTRDEVRKVDFPHHGRPHKSRKRVHLVFRVPWETISGLSARESLDPTYVLKSYFALCRMRQEEEKQDMGVMVT